MRPSPHTLLGRVHEQAKLVARHDAEALYALIDPVVRRARELEQDEEPARTIAVLRALVRSVTSAEVVEVEIVEARKVSAAHGQRPAALVRSSIRYNDATASTETWSVWVRDGGEWYSTGQDERAWPDARALAR